MMVYVGLGGFAGLVVFGALYVVFFLKGMSLKLPLIGMALCVVAVAVSAVLLNLPAKDPDAPDASGAPSQAVESGEPDARQDEAGAAPDDMAAVDSQVLLDKRGLVITSTDFDTSGSFGPELKLKIENNSESSVTIQVRNASVNGYMAETVCSIEAAAGEQVGDSITFLASGLQKCGIDTVADIEFSFHVLDGNRSVFLDSEPVQVRTSAADTYQYSYDDSGEELYSEGGLRMVSKGLSQDGAVLLIANTSDRAVTVQVRGVFVNGQPVDTIFSADVAAGKRAITPVAIAGGVLEGMGITEIREVAFSFHVVEQEGMETIFDTPSFTVRAS